MTEQPTIITQKYANGAIVKGIPATRVAYSRSEPRILIEARVIDRLIEIVNANPNTTVNYTEKE